MCPSTKIPVANTQKPSNNGQSNNQSSTIQREISWLNPSYLAHLLDQLEELNPNLKWNLSLINTKALGKLNWDRKRNKKEDISALLNAFRRLIVISHITPAIAAVLIQSGIQTAVQISHSGQKNWQSSYTHLFETEEMTLQAYKHAAGINNAVLHFLMNLRQNTNAYYRAMHSSNLSEPTDQAFGDLPSYEDLFGSLDYYDVDNYQSVLSPSAYLVDLVKFYADHIHAKQSTQQYSLWYRRPDLLNIELDDANSTTVIPQIGIANQVMKNMLGQMGYNNGNASLMEQVYPMNFPVNLSLSESREALYLLNTDYADIWKTMWGRKTQRRGEIQTAIESQSLNISQGEYELLSLPVSNDDTVNRIYGASGYNFTDRTHRKAVLVISNPTQNQVVFFHKEGEKWKLNTIIEQDNVTSVSITDRHAAIAADGAIRFYKWHGIRRKWHFQHDTISGNTVSLNDKYAFVANGSGINIYDLPKLENRDKRDALYSMNIEEGLPYLISADKKRFGNFLIVTETDLTANAEVYEFDGQEILPLYQREFKNIPKTAALYGRHQVVLGWPEMNDERKNIVCAGRVRHYNAERKWLRRLNAHGISPNQKLGSQLIYFIVERSERIIIGATKELYNISVRRLNHFHPGEAKPESAPLSWSLTETLSDLQTYMSVADIDFEDLEELVYGDLSTTEIETSVNLGFYINYSGLISAPVNLDTLTGIIQNLDSERLGRMNLLIRLSNITEQTFPDLNWVLECTRDTFSPKEKGVETETIRYSIPYLAAIVDWSNTYGIEIEESVSLIGPMKNYGAASGSTFMEAIYGQTFETDLLNKTWYYEVEGAPLWASIKQSLNLPDSDIKILAQSLAAWFDNAKNALVLTDEVLYSLYRASLYGQVFKMDMSGLLLLMSNLSYQGNSADLLLQPTSDYSLRIYLFDLLAKGAQWYANNDLDYDLLRYLLLGQNEAVPAGIQEMPPAVENMLLDREEAIAFQETFVEEMDGSLMNSDALEDFALDELLSPIPIKIDFEIEIPINDNINIDIKRNKTYNYVPQITSDNLVSDLEDVGYSSNGVVVQLAETYEKQWMKNLPLMQQYVADNILEIMDQPRLPGLIKLLKQRLIKEIIRSRFLLPGHNLKLLEKTGRFLAYLSNVQKRGIFSSDLSEYLINYQSAQQNSLNSALAGYMDISNDFSNDIYGWCLGLGQTEPVQYLLYTNIGILHPKNTNDYINYLNSLSRTIMATNSLNWNSNVVYWWINNEGFDEDYNTSADGLTGSSELQEISNSYEDIEGLLTGYLETGDIKTLNLATGWSERDIRKLQRKWTERFRTPSISELSDMNDAFSLSSSTSLSISNLLKLSDRELMVSDIGTGFENATDIILAALKTQYSGDSWSEVYEPVGIALEEEARDAYSALLIYQFTYENNLNQIDTPRLLSEYLLTDTGVAGTVDTAVSNEAILAMQTYVYRCTMNLEPNVSMRQEALDIWDWMYAYTSWEANRLVFMYPENYVQPNLLSNPSSAFLSFQEALIQNNISEEAVNTAFYDYLDRFTQVANLFIAGAYLDNSEYPASPEQTLYLIGRTQNAPYTNYWRTGTLTFNILTGELAASSFTPWREIDQAINNAQYITPIYAMNRLFIFWNEYAPAQSDRYGDDDPENAGQHKNGRMEGTVNFSYMLLNSSKWSTPQSVGQNVKLPVIATSMDDVQVPYWQMLNVWYEEEARQIGFVNAIQLGWINSDFTAVSSVLAFHNTQIIADMEVYRFNVTPYDETVPEINEVTDLNFNELIYTGNGYMPGTNSFMIPNDPENILEEYTITSDIMLSNNMEFTISIWFQITALPIGDSIADNKLPAVSSAFFVGGGDLRLVYMNANDFESVCNGGLATDPDGNLLFLAQADFEEFANEYEVVEILGSNIFPSDPGSGWYHLMLSGKQQVSGEDVLLSCKLIYLNSGEEDILVNTVFPVTSSQGSIFTGTGLSFGLRGSFMLQEILAFDTLIPFEYDYLLKPRFLPPVQTLPQAYPAVFYYDPDNLTLAGTGMSVNSGSIQKGPEIPDSKGKYSIQFNNDLGIRVSGIGIDNVTASVWFKSNATNDQAYIYRINYGTYMNSVRIYGNQLKLQQLNPNGTEDEVKSSTNYVVIGNIKQGTWYHFTLCTYTDYSTGKNMYFMLLVERDNDTGECKLIGNVTSVAHSENPTYVAAFYGSTFTGDMYNMVNYFYQLPDYDIYSLNANTEPGSGQAFPPPLIFDSLDASTSYLPIFMRKKLNGAQWGIMQTPKSSYLSVPVQYPKDMPDENNLSLKHAYTYIRLNSYVVQTLSRNFLSGGVDLLLSVPSQKSPEDSFSDLKPIPGLIIGKMPSDELDLYGANAQYFQELFFYAPWLVAQTYSNNGFYDSAKFWFEFIYNPTIPEDRTYLSEDDPDPNDKYWRYIGLRSSNNPILQLELASTNAQLWEAELSGGKVGVPISDSAYRIDMAKSMRDYYNDPYDANAIAQLRPISFQKAIVMQYVDNLINWGDSLYMVNTRETINEAYLIYLMAWDLLGDDPVDLGSYPAPPTETLGEVVDEYSGPFRKIPEFLVGMENRMVLAGLSSVMIDGTFVPNNYIPGAYFEVPENDLFLQYWDTVESRIYNIQHSLDIEGNPNYLPLFTPATPATSLASLIQSGSYADLASLSSVTIPNYRFEVLLQKAREFTQQVVSFGQSLLQALEKKDAEYLNQLLTSQQITVYDLMETLKQDQIEAAEYNLSAVEEGLVSAQNRYDYYDSWIEGGLIDSETLKLDYDDEGATKFDISADVKIAAAILHLIPTVFGFSDGDFRPGTSVESIAAVISDRAMAIGNRAGMSASNAEWIRRNNDWELQRTLAEDEIVQANYQIQAAEMQVTIAEEDLTVTQTQNSQAQTVLQFYENKFTNQDLYQWMIGQLSGLYLKSYQIAYQLALSAQTSWAYELGDSTTGPFLQSTYWNSLYKGLLAGEGLMTSLLQMEKAWLDRNKRRLEIVKTISMQNTDSLIDAFMTLIATGKCTFNLLEQLFDADYPGQYYRQIKNVNISLPALLGPYQNVHATLTQTSNKTVLEPDSNAIDYLYQDDGQGLNPPSSIRNNVAVNQQISISDGVNDSGLFQLNFDDPRFLPFEGTGAVSSWELSIPKEQNLELLVTASEETEEYIDISETVLNLSDVIIEVRYTAENGGQDFANYVWDKYSSREDGYTVKGGKIVRTARKIEKSTKKAGKRK